MRDLKIMALIVLIPLIDQMFTPPVLATFEGEVNSRFIIFKLTLSAHAHVLVIMFCSETVTKNRILSVSLYVCLEIAYTCSHYNRRSLYALILLRMLHATEVTYLSPARYERTATKVAIAMITRRIVMQSLCAFWVKIGLCTDGTVVIG